MKPIYEPVFFIPRNNTEKHWWYDIVNRFNGFDPEPLYVNSKVDPFKRINSPHMYHMFPGFLGNKCACGCGRELTGRRTRWATDMCGKFAFYCRQIICGDTSNTVSSVLAVINGYGNYCVNCGSGNRVQIDHVIGVAHGGGGCWLNNFEPLCHTCHVDKTNRTFGKGKYKPAPLFQQQPESGEIDFGLFSNNS